MLLQHAVALANRTGKVFRESEPTVQVSTKDLKDEHLKFEDWEPVREQAPERKATLEDCGCGPESKAKK